MKPDRIRAIMREKQLTCKGLAVLIGVKPRTLESYIQELRRMPEAVALQIEAVGETNKSAS